MIERKPRNFGISPGPWKISEEHFNDRSDAVIPYDLVGADGRLVVAGDGGLYTREQTMERAKANAAAIAAVPELLALLERAEAALPSHPVRCRTLQRDIKEALDKIVYASDTTEA